jgi:chemotaxis signal transduction protein
MTQPVGSSLMPRDSRRPEQVAVFSIAQYSFAISAASVQEIRSTDGLGGTVVDLDRPVLRKVRHIVERDSRAYYVVSGYEHFRLPLSRPTTVLILRSAPVAVLVDRIEEMAEMRVLLTLPESFRGEERAWYRGLTVLDRKVVPVANPLGFLTPAELQQLEEQNPGLLQTAATPRFERGRI